MSLIVSWPTDSDDFAGLYVGGGDDREAMVRVAMSKRQPLAIVKCSTHKAVELPPDAKTCGVTEYNIKANDNISSDMSLQYKQAADFIAHARAKRQGVLVHCSQGVSRSPAVAMAYLMLREHMSAREAGKLVVGKRPEAKPNAGFLSQLLALENSISPHSRHQKDAAADAEHATSNSANVDAFMKEIFNNQDTTDGVRYLQRPNAVGVDDYFATMEGMHQNHTSLNEYVAGCKATEDATERRGSRPESRATTEGSWVDNLGDLDGDGDDSQPSQHHQAESQPTKGEHHPQIHNHPKGEPHKHKHRRQRNKG